MCWGMVWRWQPEVLSTHALAYGREGRAHLNMVCRHCRSDDRTQVSGTREARVRQERRQAELGISSLRKKCFSKQEAGNSFTSGQRSAN